MANQTHSSKVADNFWLVGLLLLNGYLWTSFFRFCVATNFGFFIDPNTLSKDERANAIMQNTGFWGIVCIFGGLLTTATIIIFEPKISMPIRLLLNRVFNKKPRL